MPTERSVGAVVFRESPEGRRYLLLHYRAGHWGLVKGHVEANEAREATLRREAEEEAGLVDLELVPGFLETVSYTFRRGGQRVDKQVTFLLARTRTAEVEVTAPDEHQGIGWFTEEEARERLTFEEPRRVLEAAIEHLAAVEEGGLDHLP